MDETFDPASAPEATRVAYYGALFAMAHADGSIDKDELQALFAMVDFEGLSDDARCTVCSYLKDPPALADALLPLWKAEEVLRFSLMFNLVEIAYANDVVTPEERHVLAEAGRVLCITKPQIEAIERFVRELKVVRARGVNDNEAADHADLADADAVKRVAAGLPAVGIPIAAVSVLGSVGGLSAAGITSGLAALGLGLGMVPGIGVAIIGGTAIYGGLSKVLDIGGGRAKERTREAKDHARAEAQRKAQRVIRNMQQTIEFLVCRVQALEDAVAKLQDAAADAEANREAIRVLNELIRALKQLIERRKFELGDA
jgi:uncharacterized tellurite resistance protein B-like protein